MTISLKHLGVQYVHPSMGMVVFSLKVKFLKNFLLISKAVDLLLCNFAITTRAMKAQRLHTPSFSCTC